MIFLMPFTPLDKACAEQTLGWVNELGGCKGHSIILMPAKKVLEIVKLKELAAQSFDSVNVLPDSEGIEGHPQGPNSMMRQAIWYMQTAGLGPWMFWEPDCQPIGQGFADCWQNEYRGFGKPFMGELRPARDVTPDYLTGNMVLPKDALLLAPMLSRRGLSRDGTELAFDIVAASQTLPQAHLTTLLQQKPKNPDGTAHHFPDQASLDILRPEAVFFHPCKDGSLIQQLRDRMSGARGLNVQSIHREIEEPNEPKMLSVILEDLEHLRRENEILRAELLKLKQSVLPTKFAIADSDVSVPTVNGKIQELFTEIDRMQGLDEERKQKIKDRVAKAKATRAMRAKRSAAMKAAWVKRKAQA